MHLHAVCLNGSTETLNINVPARSFQVPANKPQLATLGQHLRGPDEGAFHLCGGQGASRTTTPSPAMRIRLAIQILLRNFAKPCACVTIISITTVLATEPPRLRGRLQARKGVLDAERRVL